MGEAKRRRENPEFVRVRTAAAEAKARRQYEELRDSGRVERAVVIAELAGGEVAVLGQEVTPHELGRLMVAAAGGVGEVLARDRAERSRLRLEPHQEPERRGVHNGHPAVMRPAVKRDADGIMVPPFGENFVSCGECGHPRWYVLHTNADDQLARYACAHCGNEVLNVPREGPG